MSFSFVDPDAKESTNFFEDLMDDDDIVSFSKGSPWQSESKNDNQHFIAPLSSITFVQSDMRARFQLGESKPIGRIGLLMSVVSKSNSNARRKAFPSSVSKQEDNPFLNGTPDGALETSGTIGNKIAFADEIVFLFCILIVALKPFFFYH